MENDGGYYALAGFLYQFNRSLLEIFNNPAQTIYLEKDEDISSEYALIQVKNHEKGRFCTSKIQKPIIQLFQQYLQNTNRKILLVGFINNWDRKKQLSKEVLDDIILSHNTQQNRKPLKKQCYFRPTDSQRLAFIASLEIDFSMDRHTQTSKVITLVAEKFKINKDLATVYHSLFTAYLHLLIVNNKKNDRKVCFNDLAEIIKAQTQLVFYSEHKKILGENKFIKLCKDRMPRFNRKKNNIFILGCDIYKDSNISNLADMLFRFVNKNHVVHTDKILNFVLNIPSNDFDYVKKYFLDRELAINDGREDLGFYVKLFSNEPLIKIGKRQNIERSSFSVRIISLETLKGNLDSIMRCKNLCDTMYVFGEDDFTSSIPTIPKFVVRDININMITQLFSIK